MCVLPGIVMITSYISQHGGCEVIFYFAFEFTSLIINEIEKFMICLWAICVFKIHPHGACISIAFFSIAQ